MTTDELFTHIGKLIDNAHADNPGADFVIEVPAASWDTCAESLSKPSSRLGLERKNFIWRGEVIVRGGKWGVVL